MKFFKLIKRWMNMFFGRSIFHVEQKEGKFYSKTELKGYYNDMTNKISEKTILDKDGIPINMTISNVEAYFPITIFQYGLGLYDLYLETKDKNYLEKFVNVANWTVQNQEVNGMWDCMGKLKNKVCDTQSSMCQSEGASLLLRAYKETKNKIYYENARKAIDFMLISIVDGGTCWYFSDHEPIFQEYVSKYHLSVLNGWIFSIFGLYDYTLVCKDDKYKKILKESVDCLCNHLKKYDRKFWSNYDCVGTIASPAYHDLHICQLNLLYELFGNVEFKIYAEKWKKYQKSKLNKILAMLIKLKQKIFKNKYYDINTSLVK